MTISLTELTRAANLVAHVRTNLHNHGLTMVGCDVAYTAALQSGAGPEMAFEMARRHMMVVMLPREVNTHTQAEYQGNTCDARAGRDRYTQQDRDNRIAQIQAVADLPNPFTIGAQS